MASKVAVCGIDLGTTTSAAAIYLPATEDKQAEVQMIRLGKSGDTIPSVVCRSPSSKIWKAGENAIAEADKDREKTHLITRSKRLVGLQYSEVLPKTLEQMLLVKKGTAGGNFKDRPIFAIGELLHCPPLADETGVSGEDGQGEHFAIVGYASFPLSPVLVLMASD